MNLVLLDWVTLNPVSGEGTKQVIATVKENEGEARSGIVQVVGGVL